MKKSVLAVLLIILLLTGCTKGNAEAVSSELEASAPAATVISTETEAAEADCAEYEIVREDRSLRNENGDILVELIYEKVVLRGSTPEISAVNCEIAADCDRFFAQSGAATYYEPETLEQMIRDMGLAYGDLFHNALATVTHNQDGLLSIRISTGWFMGGVFNGDCYGMTFDLQTGERLLVEQLSDLPEEELEARLKQITADWLNKTYGEGLFGEPEAVLAGYTLSDLLFYIENGEIILTFPTYAFTAGAAGAAVIPTGLLVADIAK